MASAPSAPAPAERPDVTSGLRIYDFLSRTEAMHLLDSAFPRRTNDPSRQFSESTKVQAHRVQIRSDATGKTEHVSVYAIDPETGQATYALGYFSRMDNYVVGTSIHPLPTFSEYAKPSAATRAAIMGMMAGGGHLGNAFKSEES